MRVRGGGSEGKRGSVGFGCRIFGEGADGGGGDVIILLLRKRLRMRVDKYDCDTRHESS